MNSLSDSLKNPKLKEKFNQTITSANEAAEKATEKFNEELNAYMEPLNNLNIDTKSAQTIGFDLYCD